MYRCATRAHRNLLSLRHHNHTPASSMKEMQSCCSLLSLRHHIHTPASSIKEMQCYCNLLSLRHHNHTPSSSIQDLQCYCNLSLRHHNHTTARSIQDLQCSPELGFSQVGEPARPDRLGKTHITLYSTRAWCPHYHHFLSCQMYLVHSSQQPLYYVMKAEG